MQINTEKTFHLKISYSKDNTILPDLLLNGNIVREVNNLKIVGFTFTFELVTDQHFDNVLKKAFSGMYIVNRIYPEKESLRSW